MCRTIANVVTEEELRVDHLMLPAATESTGQSRTIIKTNTTYQKCINQIGSRPVFDRQFEREKDDNGTDPMSRNGSNDCQPHTQRETSIKDEPVLEKWLTQLDGTQTTAPLVAAQASTPAAQ